MEKWRRRGGDGCILQTSLRLLEFESSAYLVSWKNFKYIFSFQARNWNVLYLLTRARTNVAQALRNSLWFRRAVQQPLHNIYNCSYLGGAGETAWPSESQRVEDAPSLQTWSRRQCWGSHSLPPWAPSPALKKSYLGSSWVKRSPAGEGRLSSSGKGSPQAQDTTCLW